MHVVCKYLSPVFKDKPFIFILNMCRKCKGKQSAPFIPDTSVSPKYEDVASEETKYKPSNNNNIDTHGSKMNRHCSDIVIYATRKGQVSHYSRFTKAFEHCSSRPY